MNSNITKQALTMVEIKGNARMKFDNVLMIRVKTGKELFKYADVKKTHTYYIIITTAISEVVLDTNNWFISFQETNMEKRSKTNKEIYLQKYPTREVLQNPMLCTEAIGYLKALKEYFPSEEKWIEDEMPELMLNKPLFLL